MEIIVWHVTPCSLIVSDKSEERIVVLYRRGQNSSVDMAAGPARARFIYFTASRPTVGSIQRPIQWVQEAISAGGGNAA
jgi:hypothetical protein